MLRRGGKPWSLAALLLLAGWCSSGQASPTAEEFERCEKMALSARQMCGSESPPQTEAQCRALAQQVQASCRQRVRKEHRPDWAERRAAERLRAQRLGDAGAQPPTPTH